MTFTATAVARTDVGMVRKNNEDNCLVHTVERGGRRFALWVVADGMGGGLHGEVASDTAVTTVRDHLDSTAWTDPEAALRAAFSIANSRVWDLGTGHGEATASHMGTTLVAVLLDELSGEAWFANVGDSRAYVFSGGQAEQVTTDHSHVAMLIATGQMTPEEARTAKQRNVITRSIGMERHVEVDILRGPVAPGERILLCSDGLHGMLTDEEMTPIAATWPLVSAVNGLVHLANHHGGHDNVTVLIGEVLGEGATTGPSLLPRGRWKQNRTIPVPAVAVTDSTRRLPVANTLGRRLAARLPFPLPSWLVANDQRLYLATVGSLAVVLVIALSLWQVAGGGEGQKAPPPDPGVPGSITTGQSEVATLESSTAEATVTRSTRVPVPSRAQGTYDSWLPTNGCSFAPDPPAGTDRVQWIQAANPWLDCNGTVPSRLLCADDIVRNEQDSMPCLGALRTTDKVIIVVGSSSEEIVSIDIKPQVESLETTGPTRGEPTPIPGPKSTTLGGAAEKSSCSVSTDSSTTVWLALGDGKWLGVPPNPVSTMTPTVSVVGCTLE